MRCSHHEAGECRSCTLMGTPYRVQLQRKDAAVRELLAAQVPATAWEAPLASAPEGFRTKAKFVVGGSAAAPTLGILDEAGFVSLLEGGPDAVALPEDGDADEVDEAE